MTTQTDSMPYIHEDQILEALGGAVTSKPKAAVANEGSTPSSHYSPGQTTDTEERALNLLGAGISQESVASALGVTPSRIAQLLSDKEFANKVAALRYTNLQRHNARDESYDTIEDKLLVKLDKALPLMMRPDTIMNALKLVNGAKRRGQSSPEQVVNQQNIVHLTLPTVMANKFSVNINNQVVQAGDQDLLTMPSGNLLDRVNAAKERREANLLEANPQQE